MVESYAEERVQARNVVLRAASGTSNSAAVQHARVQRAQRRSVCQAARVSFSKSFKRHFLLAIHGLPQRLNSPCEGNANCARLAVVLWHYTLIVVVVVVAAAAAAAQACSSTA
jgi:hypothetical protein